MTISKIIAENSNKTVEQIEADMFKGVVWTPEIAVQNGLVHEIKKELFEIGADVIHVQ